MPLSSSLNELGCKHQSYSRKEKSLRLLCSNFLSLYDGHNVESVGLDEAASRLGVERRRIYDIVNVLESVGVLARKAKNRYSWKGFTGIPKALEELQAEVSKENPQSILLNSSDSLNIPEKEKSYNKEGNGSSTNIGSSLSSGLTFRLNTDSRREKSLGLLTRNFVKLFLSNNADTISLDEAARLLLGDAQDSSLGRINSAAKVRRLYDIANVLSSVNLIEKTHQYESRKPAFRWLGVNEQSNNDYNANCKSSYVNENRKRTFGKDIGNIDFKRSRAVSQDDSTKLSIRIDPSSISSKSDHGEKPKMDEKLPQNNTMDYDFGPFRPINLTKHLEETGAIGAKGAQDWEAFAFSYTPQYHNQGVEILVFRGGTRERLSISPANPPSLKAKYLIEGRLTLASQTRPCNKEQCN